MNSSPKGESLTQRIHTVYPDLPKGERKAADLVLDRPGELAVLAASELADAVGVSNATVSRLFRRLGYATYEEARRASRTMRASGSPLYLARKSPEGRAGRDLSQTLEYEQAIVESSIARLNPLTVQAIARRLASARRVRSAGFRNSAFLADYARSSLEQFRGDIGRIGDPGQTVAEAIAALGPGDAVLVVGLRRRPAGFTRFVRTVAATGADIVLLADGSVRETPAYVRWSLTCVVENPQLMDSYAGAMAVIRILALATMKQLGPKARRHLELIESYHDQLDELE